ncbi:MAG TPA: histidine kinase [Puia sp.]|nr:histidine kinase [Puia sp.]
MPARRFKIALYAPAVHIVIWGVLLAIPAIIFHNASDSPALPGAFFLFTNLYHIGLFYLSALVLYPRLMTRWRWPLYWLSLGAIVALSYYAKLYILRWWAPDMPITSLIHRLLVFPPIPFLAASIIYCVVRDSVRRERMEKERKAERLTAELKFLRQQMNPHFLFNMLTNMVSLARQGSPLLEPSLIKLADLLRYSLYESGEGKVPLTKEINLIENYIDLQRLRFGEDVDIRLTISDIDPELLIEPMLLAPFVENAFKHGAGMVRDPFIHIEIKVMEVVLFFKIVNNYQDVSKEAGIGLANIRSRLELLYPRHRLTITDSANVRPSDESLSGTPGIYTVDLKIVLS